jgi:hypothetical protein
MSTVVSSNAGSADKNKSRLVGKVGCVAHNFDAVHIRHNQITENHVDSVGAAPQVIQRFTTVRSVNNLLDADLLQHATHHIADEGFIVRDHHAKIFNVVIKGNVLHQNLPRCFR